MKLLVILANLLHVIWHVFLIYFVGSWVTKMDIVMLVVSVVALLGYVGYELYKGKKDSE